MLRLESKWEAVGRSIFLGITLLGCVVPWITPRHFPAHRVLIKTQFSRVKEKIEAVATEDKVQAFDLTSWKYCKMQVE